MLVLLGGSLIAVLALGGLAGLLGLGKARGIDSASACAEAEAMLSGFVAHHAIIGSDGAAALVHGSDGSVAVLKRHGVHFAARRVAASAVCDTADGWRVDTGEAMFGAILVRR
ncbi:MAG: hypothetical protein C0476_01155 [Sphingomonas sp.]|nr:hypothetical protein [Sphingomonas sp.]